MGHHGTHKLWCKRSSWAKTLRCSALVFGLWFCSKFFHFLSLNLTNKETIVNNKFEMFLSLEHEGLIHNIRMIMNYQISSHLDFASPRAKHVAKLTEGSANEQVKLSKKTNQVGFKYMFLKTKQSKNGPIQSKIKSHTNVNSHSTIMPSHNSNSLICVCNCQSLSYGFMFTTWLDKWYKYSLSRRLAISFFPLLCVITQSRVGRSL